MTLPATLLLLAAGAAIARAPVAPAGVQVRRDTAGVHISTSHLRLDYDLTTGRWAARWPSGSAGRGGESALLRGASCAARLSDGTALTAGDYPRHECLPADVAPITDAIGTGTEITIRHIGLPGKPELRQRFQIYPDLPYFLIRLEIVGAEPVATNDIAPLVVDDADTPGAGLHLDAGGGPPRTLLAPYDNDAWVRYNAADASESYEATAIYDNASRHGFVVGSVTHDLWKTGIAMGAPGPRRLGRLRVYGGAAGKGTHDARPHGLVSGRVVASPRIFVGYFPDWRDGMEVYARANGRLHPPLTWTGGVPFGWNSWAAHKEKDTYEDYLAASDFLKQSLQPCGFGGAGGAVCVNFDSYWDNLTEAQIAAAVRHVHANGQRAGIYWTPFVCWGGDLSRPVEGTDGRYAYRDILLKDSSGTPLPTLDSGMPIDPTHPGALLRIDALLRRFIDWGFDFIKLDFLTHGALEGKHFDPAITTGTAAYNVGMRRIVADLDPARVGRPLFISLSIAPLFPAGYGHSRRLSCDAAGGVGATEYMLNSLTYGWWAEGGLYRHNDPDHTVLYQERGQRTVTEAEARSRLNASVIAGAVLLDSDDLTLAPARERAAKLLTNPEINALARAGRTFRPVEGDTGSHAADLFVQHTPGTADYYIAVFNHSSTEKVTRQVSLSRLGLPPDAACRLRDLWTGRTEVVKGAFSVDLAPTDSTLLRLTPRD